MKILIMGLPGSGKTTLASELNNLLDVIWLNADEIRKKEMIGIFQKMVEKGKQEGWLTYLKNIKS